MRLSATGSSGLESDGERVAFSTGGGVHTVAIRD